MNFLPTVVVISVVLMQAADAADRLCINANRAINKLYIDGKRYTERLKSAAGSEHCECVNIPVDSALIAVEATMTELPGYIQECNPSRMAVYKDWVCQNVKGRRFGKNMDKSSSKKWRGWYKRLGFIDRNWESPRKFACGDNHCRNGYPRQPCGKSKAKCFWSKQAATKTIRCRLKQCADACNDCSIAGPGKCNPGACEYGDGKNELTGETTCQHRCQLEMKAYGKTSFTGDAYIRVKDMVSGSSETWMATQAGDYYATIDMSNCSITNRTYFTWPTAGKGVQLYNLWNNVGSGYLKVIGVELAVGNAPPGAFSYAPWILANSLGQGIATPAAWFPNGHYIKYTADLAGVQYGDVKVTNNVMTLPPP